MEEISSGVFRLQKFPCSIGRAADNDIVLQSSRTISRIHAVLDYDPNCERFFLMDCHSHNGTALNGKPVHAREYLRDGDELMLGMCKLVFRVNTTGPWLIQVMHPAHARYDASNGSPTTELQTVAEQNSPAKTMIRRIMSAFSQTVGNF